MTVWRLAARVLATQGILLSSLLQMMRPADAADYTVRMLNQGTDGMMQFAPQLLKIAPGDTVHFTATDQGHNVQSLDGMTPDGAKPFRSEIGQNLVVTFSVPGIYGYRCTPHGTLGMVGLIVVGDPANEAAAKAAAMPGAAGRTFAKLFQTLDSTKTAAN
jgi:pseudoazurin